MPLLRIIAVVFLTSSSAVLVGFGAAAAPLDKESCSNLQNERKALLTREMQSALDHGPDWVKNHLNDAELERVRKFLLIEEQIVFRCRGGGVAKPTEQAAQQAAQTDTVPLPDPNPNRRPAATADANPSQTVADSDKTAPSKSKATR